MPLSNPGGKSFVFVSPGMNHFDASMFVSYKSLWVRLAQLVIGADHQRLHKMLHIRLVNAALALLFGEPDFLSGNVGERGERRGKRAFGNIKGKHGGRRSFVGVLRHWEPRMFQEGPIISNGGPLPSLPHC